MSSALDPVSLLFSEVDNIFSQVQQIASIARNKKLVKEYKMTTEEQFVIQALAANLRVIEEQLSVRITFENSFPWLDDMLLMHSEPDSRSKLELSAALETYYKKQIVANSTMLTRNANLRKVQNKIEIGFTRLVSNIDIQDLQKIELKKSMKGKGLTLETRENLIKEATAAKHAAEAAKRAAEAAKRAAAEEERKAAEAKHAAEVQQIKMPFVELCTTLLANLEKIKTEAGAGEVKAIKVRTAIDTFLRQPFFDADRPLRQYKGQAPEIDKIKKYHTLINNYIAESINLGAKQGPFSKPALDELKESQHTTLAKVKVEKGSIQEKAFEKLFENLDRYTKENAPDTAKAQSLKKGT